MKKVLIVAAAAGLMSLAACNSSNTPAENAVENHEANAEAYDAAADNAATPAENVLRNAEAVEENAAEAAENKM